MNGSYLNTGIFFILAILVGGAGMYITEIRQPAELQRIDDERMLARMQKAEVEQLLVEEAQTSESADDAVRKWRARYKYVPAAMETADILQYLEGLSRTGFEDFSIEMQGVTPRRDFKVHTFSLSGTALYGDLYNLIWQLENNREFYRIQDLEVSQVDVFDENPQTGERRRHSMVKFSMSLLAYFDGIDGLTARSEELMPVPEQLLPARSPAQNSFVPLIRPDPPPNDKLLVEMEGAELVSIIGSKAIVEDSRGQHVLETGDAVYLGEIVLIDPIKILVRARLNKGGIVENVELKLSEDKQAVFRRAQGRQQLRPIDQ